jgi:hypothetical protein
MHADVNLANLVEDPNALQELVGELTSSARRHSDVEGPRKVDPSPHGGSSERVQLLHDRNRGSSKGPSAWGKPNSAGSPSDKFETEGFAPTFEHGRLTAC